MFCQQCLTDLASSTPTFSMPSDPGHSSWGDENGVPCSRNIRLISICMTYKLWMRSIQIIFSMNPDKAGLWTVNAYEGEHNREGCIFLFSPLEIAAI